MAQSKSEIFVANTSGSAEVDGETFIFHEGITRIRSGSKLLKAQPQFFTAVEDAAIAYDTEKATATPGEKRGE